MKKFTAILTTILLILTLVPGLAFAEGTEASGTQADAPEQAEEAAPAAEEEPPPDAEPAVTEELEESPAPTEAAAEPPREDGAAGALAEEPVREEPQEEEGFVPSGEPDPDEGVLYAEGEVLVVFEDGVSEEQAIEAVIDVAAAEEPEELQGELAVEETITPVELAEEVTVAEAVEVLNENPEVKYAQPNYIYQLLEQETEELAAAHQPVSINDPHKNNLWHLDSVNAYDAWGVQQTNGTVKIAVIDTGANMAHEDLTGVIDKTYAWDAVDEGALTGDIQHHGTHVAGIAAAQVNNGTGVAGMSYNAQIVPIRVFQYITTESGTVMSAYTPVIARAIDYAANVPGVKVINLSLGVSYDGETDYILKGAITNAVNKGIAVVCAAGNDNSTQPMYPSDYSDTISVIALDENDDRADIAPGKGSDYGPNKDISAPGWASGSGAYSGVLSTLSSSNKAYGWLNGTSMAAPVVSGIAALLYAKYPNLPVAELKNILYSTVEDLGTEGKDDNFGYGKVDAFEALQSVVGTPSGFNVSRVGDTVAVSWDDMDDANGFELYRAVDDGDFVLLETSTEPSYLDMDVEVGKSYTYRVRALKESKRNAEPYHGNYTSSVSIGISEELNKPARLTAMVNSTDNSIVLTWSKVNDADGYKIYRGGALIHTAEGMQTLTYTDADQALQAGNSYTYQVCAYADDVDGELSDEAVVTIETLQAPDDVAVTAGSDSLTVTWSASSGAAAYQLYRSTSREDGYTMLGGGQAETAYTDTGIAANTTYYYKVKAIDSGGGESGFSAVGEGTVPGTLGAPAGFTAVENTTGVVLGWSEVIGADGYDVERSTRSSFITRDVFETAGESYMDTSPNMDVIQYYRVRAYTGTTDNKTYGPYSEARQLTVSSALLSPSGLSATVDIDGITVSWDAVAGAGAYHVYRAQGTGAFSFYKVMSATSFTDELDGLERNTTYRYRVKAVGNKLGTSIVSAYSSVAEATTPTRPAKVSGLNGAAAGTSSIKLAWAAVSGASGYEVLRYSNGSYIVIGQVSTNSYTDTGLGRGTSYYYKVRAYTNISGGKDYGEDSDTATVSIPTRLDSLNITKATYVSASTGNNSVTWAWSAMSGASGYRIYRSDNGGTARLVKDTTETSYVDQWLKNGSYTYSVCAYQKLGSTIDEGLRMTNTTPIVFNNTKPTPAAPGGMKAASAGYNSVKVSWSKAGNATGYEVYRATSKSGSYTKVGTVTSGSTVSFTNKSLTTAKTYYYKVRAYTTVTQTGHTNYGPYSAVVSAKPVPAKPGSVAVASTNYTKLKVSWAKVSGASGYVVQRATSKSGTYKTIKTITSGSTVSYTNSGLTTGKNYYYRVRAYRNVSGQKVYSSYSSIVNAKPVPKKPGSPKAVASGYNGATVSWLKVSGASGYEIYRSTKKTSGFSRVKTVKGGSAVRQKVGGMNPGTQYYFKVRAYRTVSGKKVYGGYSSVVTATSKIAKVSNPRAVSASKSSIKVNWTRTTGASGYEVHMRDGATGAYTLERRVSGGSKTSFTSKSLETGKVYSYKIRAYRNVGGKRVYGAFSKAVSTWPRA